MYVSAAGVEAAIKDAAKRAAAADPTLDAGKRIHLEYFNRFLSRVFSEGEGSGWVLKGGTGILARVPSARSTRDIDLCRAGDALGPALTDLTRLAAIDLHDHFTFEYAHHSDSIGADTQPYSEGYRVRFNVHVGLSARGSLQIDLAVGAGVTGQIITTAPANALDLPKLVSHPYRLFPVVDQIADKVCATVASYNGSPSSREKDLVDLVVFATTQDIDGRALRRAIVTEARRRRMEPIDTFTVPSMWGSGYAKLSKTVPHCHAFATVALARDLVSRFIDPSLTGLADNRTWSHRALTWQ
ncbi:hypothetical protein N802_13705 [Knoellia sinensis KCTC 19936]|uniref:Nucleotidyl transferase AbiEii/AbiGii toxin family protein n=1 Tax=Knoellia sinensis KCTC 19936 TaxID=1385520 RepID=A0A0A0IW05_9MICO|nr:hypothetical protein N802_13705 [Knoellia sinensis KCTC 19936]